MPTSSDNEAVRPTRKSLDDLGIAIPPVAEALHEIDDQHVKEMQKMPERVLAGGADGFSALRIVFGSNTSPAMFALPSVG